MMKFKCHSCKKDINRLCAMPVFIEINNGISQLTYCPDCYNTLNFEHDQFLILMIIVTILFIAGIAYKLLFDI